MGKHSNRRRSLVSRLLSVFGGEEKDLLVVGVYSVVIGICSLAVPIAVQAIVSSVASSSVIQPLVVLTVFVAGVLTFSGILTLLQMWLSELIQRRLMVRCSVALARQLPQVKVRDFRESYGSDYVVRYMELFNIQKMTTMIILDGSAVFFQITVGLILVSFYHPFFLVYALVLLGCINFIIFVLGVGGIRSSEAESNAKYGVMSWLQALAHHPDSFKSASAEQFAIKRTDRLVTDYLTCRATHFSVLFRQNFAGILLQAVASALLLGLGGWLVIKGQLTLGQLVAAELVFGLVLISVTKLGKQLEKFYALSSSVTKLDSLFNLPYETPAGDYFGVANGPAHISVKDVTLVPPGYTEALLEKIDFSLAPGEKAVLWGPNASGKSFLADVIYRSAEALSGRVEIDGHPISAIHPKELRSELAIVRGIELFPGSVEENLVLGRQVSHQSLRNILELVGLAERVYSLHDGVGTAITGICQPFSSGEALRLMLARALLAEPRLLVIDGTLDSMDDTSQDLMLDLIGNKLSVTVLLLTHELSMARGLPRAFAIEGKRIVERGL